MAMNSRSEFPKRLKKLRKELGYTPKEFAKKLNVGLQRYYTYENGHAVPNFDCLTAIADACDISLDWLCGLSPITQRTMNKTEITTMLAQLISANEMGKQIEVHISCEGIN